MNYLWRTVVLSVLWLSAGFWSPRVWPPSWAVAVAVLLKTKLVGVDAATLAEILLSKRALVRSMFVQTTFFCCAGPPETVHPATAATLTSTGSVCVSVTFDAARAPGLFSTDNV